MHEILKTYNSPYSLEDSYMEQLVKEYNEWVEQGYHHISLKVDRPQHGEDVIIRITGIK